MKNYKDTFEAIFQMEEEMDLFNQKIDEVYFWELIRFNIVRIIVQNLGYQGQAHTQLDFNANYLIRKISNSIKNIFQKNPFLSSSVDYLFVGHPRRKLMEDGLWWDIYCDPIIENLKNKRRCALLEYPHLNNHSIPSKTTNIYYLDFVIFIGGVWKTFRSNHINFKIKDKLKITAIEDQIKAKLGIVIRLEKLIFDSIKTQKIMVAIYTHLLKSLKPKIVIFLVSYGYGNEIFINACKNFGVPTVELQHGMLSRYHAGYSFPNKKAGKKSFPDYFFTFGDYWNKKVKYPISDKNVYSVGYPLFEIEFFKYKNNVKRNQILFISQGTIGKQLSKFAVELSKMEDFPLKIVYKLHSGEVARWKKEYPWLKNSEVRVVDDTKSLYELLAQSKILIGVYSTAIYEGLGMGLKTFLVNLPGAENMDDLVESKAVIKVDSVKNFIKKYNSTYENRIILSSYFFKPNAIANIEDVLKKIEQKHYDSICSPRSF
jgi:hypothetical protein